MYLSMYLTDMASSMYFFDEQTMVSQCVGNDETMWVRYNIEHNLGP